MLYKDFINQLRTNLKLPKNKTSSLSKSLIELLKESIEKDTVHITGFGKFYKTKDGKVKFEADKTFIKEANIK